MQTAEAIAVAEIVELGEPVGEHRVRAKMRAVRWYKRNSLVPETFEKTVQQGDAGMGRKWLVSFYKDKETGEISQAGECTDGPIEDSTSKVSFLDDWAAGSLSGLTQLRAAVGFDGVTVVAEGAGQRYKALSKSGVATFNGIPQGVYTVGASGPGFAPMDPEDYREVDLLESACSSAGFRLETTNRVSGVLLGPEGSPVAGVPVKLIQADEDGVPKTGFSRTATTDSEGRYVFEGEDPGKYWIGVTSGPYPVTLYPGVSTFEDATLIDLGPGAELTDFTLHLPRRLDERSIRVRVLWSDGTPAVGARVNPARDWDFDDPHEYCASSGPFDSSRADEEGWVKITVSQGRKYRLVASYVTLRHQARLEKSPPGQSLRFEIEPGPGPLDLEVRLRRYEILIGGGKKFLE